VVQPHVAFAALVGRVLEADAAEREGDGNRLERLGGDGDADHAGLFLFVLSQKLRRHGANLVRAVVVAVFENVASPTHVLITGGEPRVRGDVSHLDLYFELLARHFFIAITPPLA